MIDAAAEQAWAQAQVLQALASLGPQLRATAVLARRLGWPQSRLRRVLTPMDGSDGGVALVECAELAGARGLREGWRLTMQGWALVQAADGPSGTSPGAPWVWRERWSDQGLQFPAGDEPDRVVDEAPIALLYNGHPLTVMMATPLDLEDFAVGYSLTEAIVDRAERVQVVDIVRHGEGYAVHLAVDAAGFDAARALHRSAAGSASCGLCGTAELDAALPLLQRVTRPADGSAPAVWAQLQAGLRAVQQAQSLNRLTGGAHAAGVGLADGTWLVREDIGRHSAVDKVMGAVARAGAAASILVLTSRLSYEIVRKAARVGVHTLGAMSAPSALALRHAFAVGIEVWAFVREQGGNRYRPVAADGPGLPLRPAD